MKYWIFVESLLFLSFNSGRAFQCPNESFYNNILNMGCYKIVQLGNKTWDQASKDCENDTNATVNGQIIENARAHLLSIEHSMKMTALSTWLAAYGLLYDFWTDGDLPKSIWTWSNQSITWFFTEEQRNITGTGTKLKLAYNATMNGNLKYQIADDDENKHRKYICEYQVPCNDSGTCQNGATCYINMGQNLCICAPGFTGDDCSIIIDECLQAPCQHNGVCIRLINNYTCNCSETFYEGRNCEIPKDDTGASQRSAAFWSVLGIVTGLVVFLTLSDLPWDDILSTLGCSCHRFTCCLKRDETKNSDDNLHELDTAVVYDVYEGKKLSAPNDMPNSGKTNFHVMNSNWDSEYPNNQTPTHIQYNGYRSPEHVQTSAYSNMKTFTNVVTIQQNQKQSVNKYGHSVNVNEPRAKSKDSVDTMVNWTQQLQQQLKYKPPRETSASSTKQLIHKTSSNDS